MAAAFVMLSIPGSLGTSPNDACFSGGCHTSSSLTPINISLYDSNPHSIIKCTSCHVNSTSRNDSGHGQFIRTLNGSKITGPLTTSYYSENFSLCYYCHNESKVVGMLPDYVPSSKHVNNPIIVTSIGTNFINIDPAGHYDGGFDIPTNIHWNHLDSFGSTRWGEGGMFDYNMSGNTTSYQSCPACHNVHGTNYPKMTRNDLAITYSSDTNGTFGYIGSNAYLSLGGDVYCNGCHTSGPNYKYYRNETNLFEDCISCHVDGVPDDVNRTTFVQGVHVNINTTNGTGLVNNSDCWTCHYQKDMNRSNIYTCAACHVQGAVPAAPRVTSHKPEKINKTSCEECHDLVKLDPGLNRTGVPYPNITGHYALSPTVPTVNYCDYCHGPNASSPFSALNRSIPLFSHDSSNASFPENSTCRTCHARTDILADPQAQDNSSFHNLSSEYGDASNGTTKANCVICHVNHESQFANAPNPPHSTTGYTVADCYMCHASGAEFTNAQKLHNIRTTVLGNCIQCHDTNMNDVKVNLFGRHINVNTTDGMENATDNDCKTCHFGAWTGDLQMKQDAANASNTYYCQNCHTDGNFSAPIIMNHRPAGLTITTTAYCSTCHNNSINKYKKSINASVSHYGTNTSLVKPTVNQTAMPRFGFMTQTDASSYNTACSNCHNRSNPDYGNATNITMPHTVLGTCNECHVNGNASDLHNSTLGKPLTNSCQGCHTNYAARYNAPNLTGTEMVGRPNCESCHGGGDGSQTLNTLSEHNTNRNFTGTAGTTDTVYLNGQRNLTINRGTPVQVTSRIKDYFDTGASASRVGGAEYYMGTDPGTGRANPMDPADGLYNAANGNWENVTGTIDTSGLAEGNYTVYVRGMDIGKQWSPVQSATLIVQAPGYINGTVTNTSGSPVSGAVISTTGASVTTAPDGTYSLNIAAGTYDVTANKQPEYYINISTGVAVTPDNATLQDFVLTLKPTGTITGNVTN